MIDQKSIAVLPFDNLSSDPENEYFSDGMTEEIINALSKINGLKVTARTSSFVFKKQKEDVRIIGNKLGVTTVLEGSIRKSGERVRITAQLIRTDNGFHIWSENFDRRLEDIFALQDDISLLIADRIRENFGHIEITEHLVEQPTENIEAYQQYLKGRHLFLTWNLVEMQKGLSYFARSIELDPTYDQPYFGMALCYSLLGAWGYMPKQEAYLLAESFIESGNKLQHQSVLGFYAQAVHEFWAFWNYSTAYGHLQSASALNEQDPEPIDFMAEINRSLGNFDTALALNAKGLTVNPLSTNAYFTKATLLYLQEDYDNALIVIEEGLKLDPVFTLLQNLKLICLILSKNHDELNRYHESITQFLVLPEIYLRLYELYNGIKIPQNQVDQLIEKVDAMQGPPVFPLDIYLCIYSGKEEEALQRLNAKVNAKMGQVANFKNDPFLAPLRDSESFKSLVNANFPDDPITSPRAGNASSEKALVLSDDETNSYSAKLITQMEEHQSYLDTQLTLRELADRIDLHPNKLSWLLNEKVGRNFNDFVNGYRLSEFQRKAVDPDHQHLTLLGLAYESGFTSKSVFNDFFKKQTGVTPKAWVNQAKKS